MFDLFLKAIREALLEGIRVELTRLNRDVTENDGLEFFSYSDRANDDATHITATGVIMAGTITLDAIDQLDAQSTDTLETLYQELNAIDDDQDSIDAIGRAVLEALGLQGRDVVDVVQEEKTLIGTGDGRVFSFTLFEVGTNGELPVQT